MVWLSLPVMFAGLALDELGQSAWAHACCWATVALMHGGVVFALSTVAVELDASRRALGTLRDLAILEDWELRVAGVILAAAAGTYIASAAGLRGLGPVRCPPGEPVAPASLALVTYSAS